MPRGKRTPGKTQSITKKAVKNFHIWNEQREDKSEEFRQCKKIKYWFVSDRGNVISFYNSEEPKYLKIKYNENGRAFVVSGRGENSITHYIHRLQAEVFKVYAYGKARKKTLAKLEVHHQEGHTVNRPDALEILEPNTHNELFNKKNVPGMSDNASEHIKYMQTVGKIVEENTPNQAVVVFSGTGIVKGEETKDLTQVIYADDFPGVNDIVNQVKNELVTNNYVKSIPETEKDRKALTDLMEQPGELEKLEEYISKMANLSQEPMFYTNYKGINLIIERITMISS